MAQTRKHRRRTKHRGNAVGMIESRGRTGRKPTGTERGSAPAKETAAQRRERRANQPPTWNAALSRAAISAVLFVALVILFFHQAVTTSILLGVVVMLVYVPLGYYTDRFAYRRRMARRAAGKG
ncbi:MAG TPA: hypothetical protein VHB30_03760 [Solirubrobacteraceae bacterium]|jgi:hypothetical protein|nr:hypothetical protein [Solirubrobacteraceae bacterium]